jgi:hypothetical protein
MPKISTQTALCASWIKAHPAVTDRLNTADTRTAVQGPPRAVVKPLAVISHAVFLNVMPPALISRITGRCVAACSAAFLDHAAAARAAPSRSAGRRFP